MENHHESEVEGSLSGPENEHDMSEEEDDDSRISNTSPRPPDVKFNPAMIDPEMITKLKQQGVPWVQEDVDRAMGPFFFPSPHVLASQLAAAAAAVAKDKDSHRDRSPPLRFTDEAHTSQAPGSDSSTSSTSSQQTWSFEEQFKQLYELSDDIKRKEFLDELFSFMQKRGTPINRLPIMAKQVLDLYELYNLVIARGGLVDVINKKLWQEIIRGLQLPSSITSAAFTLRTQYMKYLYPYECEKKRLSTPSELQAAIDGNKREGRRASYGPYPDMISPLSLVGGRPQMNGNGNSHSMHSTSPNSPPNAATPNARDALAALELSRLTLWNLYGGGGSLAPEPKAPPQQEALNLEVPTRNSETAQTPKVPTHSNNIPTSPRSTVYTPEKENGKRHDRHDRHDHHNNNNNNNHHGAPPPPKRLAIEDPETSPRGITIPALTGANIKINSRGDGRGSDTSLVVSMEINGIMYQGVLFAQNSSVTRVV